MGRDAANHELAIIGVEERHRRLNQHAAVAVPDAFEQLGLHHERRSVRLASEHAHALKGRMLHSADLFGHDLMHLRFLAAGRRV